MSHSVDLLGAWWIALAGLMLGLAALRAWRTRVPSDVSRSDMMVATKPMAPHHDLPLTTFEARKLDVSDEASCALGQLRDTAEQQQVEFGMAVQPELTVWADPRAFRQILLGALVPAIERGAGGAVL